MFFHHFFQASYEEFMAEAQATASRGMHNRISFKITKCFWSNFWLFFYTGYIILRYTASLFCMKESWMLFIH